MPLWRLPRSPATKCWRVAIRCDCRLHFGGSRPLAGATGVPPRGLENARWVTAFRALGNKLGSNFLDIRAACHSESNPPHVACWSGRRDSTEKGVSGMRSNSKATPLAKFLSFIALGLSMMTHAIADEDVPPGSSSRLEEIVGDFRWCSRKWQQQSVCWLFQSPARGDPGSHIPFLGWRNGTSLKRSSPRRT
jgi:hypothetical protein